MQQWHGGLIVVIIGILVILFRKVIRRGEFNAMFGKTPANPGEQLFTAAFGAALVFFGLRMIYLDLIK